MVMCRPKSRFGSIQPGGKFYRLVSTVRYQSPRMHEHFSLSLWRNTFVFRNEKFANDPAPLPHLLASELFVEDVENLKKKKREKKIRCTRGTSYFFLPRVEKKKGTHNASPIYPGLEYVIIEVRVTLQGQRSVARLSILTSCNPFSS